jgi:hypothetical protein
LLCNRTREAAVTGFRILLIAMLAALAVYTGVVVAAHGLNFLPVALSDVTRMAWPGQFDLDFTMMLTLSALWVAWRHQFSPAGLGLALLAFFGGASFLTVYLLVLSVRAKGDMAGILLGGARTARPS